MAYVFTLSTGTDVGFDVDVIHVFVEFEKL